MQCPEHTLKGRQGVGLQRQWQPAVVTRPGRRAGRPAPIHAGIRSLSASLQAVTLEPDDVSSSYPDTPHLLDGDVQEWAENVWMEHKPKLLAQVCVEPTAVLCSYCLYIWWCRRRLKISFHSPCPLCPLCTPTLSLHPTVTLKPTPTLNLLLTLLPILALDPNPKQD